MDIFFGITHVTINLYLYWIMSSSFGWLDFKKGGIVVVIIGSVLADIDNPKSLINKYLILPFYLLFGSHRGISHTVLAASIIGLLFGSYKFEYGLLMFFSYLMHLVADSFTKMGVPWLYPWKRKRYGLKLFKSGNGIELFLVVFIFMAIWTSR